MQAFKIGRIFGIELRVDWSWVFIFVLMTWNLCDVFGHWHPHGSAVETGVVGVVGALLFFGCVLLHELAHSAMALRFGLPVRSITLFLFGGASNVEKEPASARVELWTAIVGPLTSLAIGAIFLACGAVATSAAVHDARSVADAMSTLGPVTTLLVWLGPANTIIGVFNMIPAFPLDGGRVLRALLWRATGNLGQATLRAGVVAQGLAWALVVLGIAMSFGFRVPFFGSGLVAGMWLAFIGWFVRGAASQATGQVAIDEAMAGRVVADVMRREGDAISPDLPLASFVHDHLIRSGERALPVVLGGRLLGLVSSADLRAVPTGQWPWTRVSSVMRPEALLLVTTPYEPLAAAFHRMMNEDVAQLPVLAEGHLVGMLHRRDIVRWLELTWSPRARQGGLAADGPPLYTGHA